MICSVEIFSVLTDLVEQSRPANHEKLVGIDRIWYRNWLDMRVLLVEDEKKLSGFIRRGLEESSYAVDLAEDAKAARQISLESDYDLIILDVMLPDGSGFEVAKFLRTHDYRGPILMLTALATTQDKVRGLDSGADDYLTKPFAIEELLARLRALMRRYGGAGGRDTSVLKFADIEINLIYRKAYRNGVELKLTVKEFALLEYFIRNPKRPLLRSEILEHVWDMNFDPGSNVVDVYVNLLRKKLEQANSKKLIQTVVGFGYELTDG